MLLLNVDTNLSIANERRFDYAYVQQFTSNFDLGAVVVPGVQMHATRLASPMARHPDGRPSEKRASGSWRCSNGLLPRDFEDAIDAEQRAADLSDRLQRCGEPRWTGASSARYLLRINGRERAAC